MEKELEDIIDDLQVDAGLQILGVRITKNLSQEKLAKMMGTKQPSIARAERGRVMPSMELLAKIALKTGSTLIPPQLIAHPKGVTFNTNIHTIETAVFFYQQIVISN